MALWITGPLPFSQFMGMNGCVRATMITKTSFVA
jgi:hypothetical protein